MTSHQVFPPINMRVCDSVSKGQKVLNLLFHSYTKTEFELKYVMKQPPQRKQF
jgi:hypothetical protein